VNPSPGSSHASKKPERRAGLPLPSYGVLIGSLIRFAREDPSDFGSWYHGKLYVGAPEGQYECAVDVSTPSGVGVQYRIVHGLDRSLFAPVLALGEGWHLLARTSSSGALDYIRSPLLKIQLGCMFAGATWLWNLLTRIFEGLLNAQWTASTGDNALDELERQVVGSTRLFVFGAPYTSGLGVHDIHMNQGDPPGPFQPLDGIWQDGATIAERPDGELVAVLIKFATQSLTTNEQGLPV
jgi:hypothetical protein